MNGDRGKNVCFVCTAIEILGGEVDLANCVHGAECSRRVISQTITSGEGTVAF